MMSEQIEELEKLRARIGDGSLPTGARHSAESRLRSIINGNLDWFLSLANSATPINPPELAEMHSIATIAKESGFKTISISTDSALYLLSLARTADSEIAGITADHRADLVRLASIGGLTERESAAIRAAIAVLDRANAILGH